MIDAGIQAGGLCDCPTAGCRQNPGDIVVALLGEEVTVKRLRKKGGALFLEAANAAYEPIPLTGSFSATTDFRDRGRAVSELRQDTVRAAWFSGAKKLAGGQSSGYQGIHL